MITEGVQQADGSYIVTLTEEPDFEQYGSADVLIEAMDACGAWSEPASYVICDDAIMPGTKEFGTPPGPFQGEDVVTFDWSTGIHPTHDGHMYQLEYYNTFIQEDYEPRSGFKINSDIGTYTEYGINAGDLLDNEFTNGNEMVFRERSMNRCRVPGGYGKYLVYEKAPCGEDKYG